MRIYDDEQCLDNIWHIITLTSTLPLNAMRNSFFTSLEKTRWNVCLNKDVLNESPITMWPLHTLTRPQLFSLRIWPFNSPMQALTAVEPNPFPGQMAQKAMWTGL